jgi:two-component system chemotaxis response regulator CheB
MGKAIKVLIVDDSAIVRRVLSEQLAQDAEIEVVGTAPDPYVARDKIVHLQPDVVTLDLEMPRMDGLSFLKKLMEHYPIPVIILSSYTARGCLNAVTALELGAFDVLRKPDNSFSLSDMSQELIEKIKVAAKVKIPQKKREPSPVVKKSSHSTVSNVPWPKETLVAIGASTGGTEALKEILATLPATFSPVLVVQHMPEHFTRAFADRLNEQCLAEVKEAEDGDFVQNGRILIARGNYHMLLRSKGGNYYVQIRGGGYISHHRPSVDVLFRSVAKIAGTNAIGVILTGMGADGAHGILEMKIAGAKTIAQDEKSCVVFGMPKEAIALGAVDKVLPLDQISQEILKMACENRKIPCPRDRTQE